MDDLEFREAPASLSRRVEDAYRAGVSEEAILHCLNALERGASGRRFCVVLSINGTKVWAGETPLHRVDFE